MSICERACAAKAASIQMAAVGADVKAAFYGIGFQQGSALRDKANVALLEMQETGEYDKLYIKWFGSAPE